MENLFDGIGTVMRMLCKFMMVYLCLCDGMSSSVVELCLLCRLVTEEPKYLLSVSWIQFTAPECKLFLVQLASITCSHSGDRISFKAFISINQQTSTCRHSSIAQIIILPWWYRILM